MDSVSQIKLPDEMRSPVVRVIFDALGDGHVRFVGGAVRNALLGVKIGDIDLATTHLPQNATDRLIENSVNVVPTGIAHGTITAVVRGKSFEITTLRIDEKTDGRHAEVAFSTSWEGDARRRDFTMNALYADFDGTVYDPLGRGLADLEARRVVFVGDAETRIREDYLRILRFFRFSLYYGEGRLDRAGLEACTKLARGLSRLSRERVTQEFFKILRHQNPLSVLEKMYSAAILRSLFSRKFDPNIMKRLLEVRSDCSDDLSLVVRLVSLCGGFGSVDKWLILNRNQKRMFEKIRAPRLNTIRLDTYKLLMWVYYDGVDMARARLDMVYAHGRLARDEYLRFVDVINMPIPAFPVSSRDLMEQGYEGAALGFVLKKLEERWLKSGFRESREVLLGLLPLYDGRH